MHKYRARLCPKCNYFVGLAITRTLKSHKAPVTAFCLNCNYHLPVHSIIDGSRKSAAPRRRARLRLVSDRLTGSSGFDDEKQRSEMEAKISPANYARHLRAIGQDLEILRFSHFNLEFTGDEYLVWVKSSETAQRDQPLLRVSKTRLKILWRHRTARTIGQDESFP